MSSANEGSATPMTSRKDLKAMQKNMNAKSETFYVKKRGLFRKAEQLVRYCNSEVFIIVHNKDTDKLFSFTSDQQFNLEKISELVLRDVQHGAILKKTKKFESENFANIRRNITEIEQINRNYDQNFEKLPYEKVQDKNNEQLIDRLGGVEPDTQNETQTEQSMSANMLPPGLEQVQSNNTNELSNGNPQYQNLSPRSKNGSNNLPPGSARKMTQRDPQKHMMSPRGKDINADAGQGVSQVNMQNHRSNVQRQNPQNPPYDSPQFQQMNGGVQNMTQQNQNGYQQMNHQQQFQPPYATFGGQQQEMMPNNGMFNQNGQHPHGMVQYPQSNNFFSDMNQQHYNPEHEQNQDTHEPMMEGQNKSQVSKVSVDPHLYQKEKFETLVDDRQLQQTVDCNDMFIGYDRDDIRYDQMRKQQYDDHKNRSGVDNHQGSGLANVPPSSQMRKVMNDSKPRAHFLSGVQSQELHKSDVSTGQFLRNQGPAKHLNQLRSPSNFDVEDNQALSPRHQMNGGGIQSTKQYLKGKPNNQQHRRNTVMPPGGMGNGARTISKISVEMQNPVVSSQVMRNKPSMMGSHIQSVDSSDYFNRMQDLEGEKRKYTKTSGIYNKGGNRDHSKSSSNMQPVIMKTVNQRYYVNINANGPIPTNQIQGYMPQDANMEISSQEEQQQFADFSAKPYPHNQNQQRGSRNNSNSGSMNRGQGRSNGSNGQYYGRDGSNNPGTRDNYQEQQQYVRGNNQNQGYYNQHQNIY